MSATFNFIYGYYLQNLILGFLNMQARWMAWRYLSMRMKSRKR